MELKPSDIKKLAKIIDERGSLSIGLDNHNNKQYYYEQYRLSGTEDDNSSLLRFRELFGGTVSKNGVHCKRIWRITADKAYILFNLVFPHLIKRKKIMEVLLKFSEQRIKLSGTKMFSEERENQKAEFLAVAKDLREEVKQLSDIERSER